jgi:acyl carrier protein
VTQRLDREPTIEGRHRIIRETVLEQVRHVLGLAPGTAFDPDQGFFEAGMDSITSMELKVRLENLIGTDLPTTTALEHPTVTLLARYLAVDVLHIPEPQPVVGDPPTPAGIAGTQADAGGTAGTAGTQADAYDDLLSLSEDELATLLLQELDGQRHD